MSFPENYIGGYHVRELRYLYSDDHAMIGLGNLDSIGLENIGERGCELTIAVLSMNRSSLTIRLMNSVKEHIPDFRGEFLIGDNGSNQGEKDKLKAAMEEMPFSCRMIEFDRNYGVAGGRNRLFAEVRTDWIFSMDNDLYFVGDPLEKIRKDLKMLGCHFMIMPMINAGESRAALFGGNIYIDNVNGVSAGAGTALIVPEIEINREYDPFLCTFLAGGISIINKESFFENHGFDEGMFVGFEDTEFSLRLYQKGIKVGACGIACVIHDHPKPTDESAKNYERARFSNKALQDSARYFERKHGFSVWNPAVDKWLLQRKRELDISSGDGDGEKPRRKIAVIVDRPGWAFDNIAGQIVKNMSGEFDVKVIYQCDYSNVAQILMLAEECELIHFLWRPIASCFYNEETLSYIRSLRLSPEEFRKRYVDEKTVSVAVYDHLMLDEAETDSHYTRDLFSSDTSLVNKYCVSSRKLWDIYQKDSRIAMKPSAIVSDGVDLELFRPEKLRRLSEISGRTVKIGWTGNSKWVAGDLKGINTVIKPAIEQLRQEGYPVELVTSDRENCMIPHDEMPQYYNGLDLYVCASLFEGTPNPILEAMACGLPVISTDVGIVPEVLGEQQKRFILRERSVPCLKAAIKDLLEHPELFETLSRENLRQIQAWDWKRMTYKMRDYFLGQTRDERQYGSVFLRQEIDRMQAAYSRVYYLVLTACCGNAGDHAIELSERELMRDCGIENFQIFDFFEYALIADYLSETIRKNDVLLIPGGGNLGDSWAEEYAHILSVIRKYPENPILVFPESWYFSDSEEGKRLLAETREIISHHKNITLYARDSWSFREMRRQLPGACVKYAFDCALLGGTFYDEPETLHGGAITVGISVRDDKEAKNRGLYTVASEAVSRLGYDSLCIVNDCHEPIGKHAKQAYVNAVLSQYRRADIVITDRFHGMIFSLLCRKPCIVFDNRTGKIHHFAEDIAEDVRGIVCAEDATVDALVGRIRAMAESGTALTVCDSFYKKRAVFINSLKEDLMALPLTRDTPTN